MIVRHDTNEESTITIAGVTVPSRESVTTRHEAAEQARQSKADEDMRANRRNRNRSLTLVVALCMTFAVPALMTMMGLAPLLKFATGIAIIPDAIITLYAYVRKY